MVAAAGERRAATERTAAIAAIATHECVCRCGRCIGKTEAPLSLPAGLVFAKIKCRDCREWRWFDAATGKARFERDKARRVVG